MKKMFLTIAALLLFATTAFAESGKDTGFYGGVDVGYGRVNSSAQETADTFVNAFGGSATVVQHVSAPVGRIFAGYTINQNFALELGFLQTGDFDQDIFGNSGGFPYTVKETDSASGFEFSALIRPVTENGWEKLFIRAGGHHLNLSAEWTAVGVGGSASGEINRSGNGFLIGVGYDTQISKTLSYRSAYTYYNKVGGGSDNAHVFTIGLLAKF